MGIPLFKIKLFQAKVVKQFTLKFVKMHKSKL